MSLVSPGMFETKKHHEQIRGHCEGVQQFPRAPRPWSFSQWPRAALFLSSSVLSGSPRFVLPSVQEPTSLSPLLTLLLSLGFAWLVLSRAHQLALGLWRSCLQTWVFSIHGEQGFLKGSLLTTCAWITWAPSRPNWINLRSGAHPGMGQHSHQPVACCIFIRRSFCPPYLGTTDVQLQWLETLLWSRVASGFLLWLHGRRLFPNPCF